MAGQIAMHEANVVSYTSDIETGNWPSHQVLVRNGRAVVQTRDGVVVRERGGIVSTARDGAPGAWRVTFTDGETWTIRQVQKPCGACS